MTAADRPSVTPRVGDVITTAEQLDTLPVGSVLRTRSGALAETGDMRGKPSRVVWCEGWSEHADAVEHFAPLTVLYVPGEQTHPSVDALRAEEGIEAATEAVEAEFASMNAGSDHGARDVAEAAISAYGSALAPVTPADRPSVTDDARAETTTGAIAREAFIAGAEWAAARAETTTATTEVALDSLPYFTFEDDDVAPDEEFVRKADVARLLATTRTRPTREQIARALDHAGAFCGECGAEPGDFFDSCLECQRWLLNYADAVLALLGGDNRG